MGTSTGSRGFSSSRLYWALCAVCLLGVAAGCSAQAQLPEVVVTHDDIAVDGVGSGRQGTRSTRVVLPDISRLTMPEGADAQVWVRSLTARVGGSVPDLSFLRRLKLVVSPASRDDLDTTSRTLIDYRVEPGTILEDTVTMYVDEEVELVELLRLERPAYELTLSGWLPPDDWTLSVSVALEGRLAMALAKPFE